ncbi:hypothetical protein T10_11189 [Trichinella papuae]|uniref:Uncharacterized protein n=1 Tax=Trichinella papuae TaxID=268474 RepID=A0A0V1M547_9BILA|nr:hypothetical protein T10_11189 [Trichinella papuae]
MIIAVFIIKNIPCRTSQRRFSLSRANVLLVGKKSSFHWIASHSIVLAKLLGCLTVEVAILKASTSLFKLSLSEHCFSWLYYVENT